MMKATNDHLIGHAGYPFVRIPNKSPWLTSVNGMGMGNAKDAGTVAITRLPRVEIIGIRRSRLGLVALVADPKNHSTRCPLHVSLLRGLKEDDLTKLSKLAAQLP